jgi:site-specific recombinase XerC
VQQDDVAKARRAPDALSSWRVGDYEFDLDRRVARQLGDPDCGTGMPTALPEKLCQQSKEVWAIRVRLQIKQTKRDLAMFNLAIDSKLRGCDLVSLRVDDIAVGGHVRDRATIVRNKTNRPVQFEITEQTRASLQDWLDARPADRSPDCPENKEFPRSPCNVAKAHVPKRIAKGGLVTLATKERGGPAALEILSSRDCLAPRAHRRGAESAMG